MSEHNAAHSAVDYIIIGGGSAGCVLANRLSADPQQQVLLLEAGGSDHNLWVQMPLGFGRLFYEPKLNWMFQTAAEPELDGRSCYWPRGKVLGGSGSINAMLYVRGLPGDFERWQAAGNPGWGWDEVLPVFERLESYPGAAYAGELGVSDVRADLHPLNQHFFQAARHCGFAMSADFNTDTMEGVGAYCINTRNGWRASSANALLRPALCRSNLDVRLNAMVTRILLTAGDATTPPRACGVEYLKHGQRQRVTARHAVILSGGAVNSPQLLQLSGVGDPALLQALGISLVKSLPAVGQYLQDHLAITYQYKSRLPSLNNELYPWRGKLKAAWQYLWQRRGLLAMSVNQAGGFVRSDPRQAEPDLQLYFNALTYDMSPAERRGKLLNPHPFAAFSLSFNACRPHSRGEIRITTPDPLAKPLIQPNYLSAAADAQKALAGCRLLRRLAKSPGLRECVQEEVLPGPAVASDEALLADFRARAGSIFHASGSCRMGPDAADSVVNARLQVHGVEGLWVVDASVFPFIPSGNTNAPTMMVAEKAAGMILAQHHHSESPQAKLL